MTKSIALIIATIIFLCAVPVKAQVPVSLLPVVRQQFFGANGLPLAGGFVYTYVAGTSVPAPTYLDYTGTAQNTNPITLDSGGFAAIWIPAAPVDVAVFNSSMTQQYEVLSVTALPAVVNNLTANFFQSSSTNPALSGFLRMASADQVCWRNNGNSADLCISKNSGDALLYGGQPFGFLNTEQTWMQPQIFTGLFFTGGTAFNSQLTNVNTAIQTYLFPNASGQVCISMLCNVTNPIINGVTITNAPSGVGQPLTSTSTTTAAFGALGSIVDYDLYGGFALFGVSPPVTNTLQTLPIGAVQDANLQGSYIEGEIMISSLTYTGSPPVFQLNVNGTAIGPAITMVASCSYDIRFTLALSSTKAPQAVVNVLGSTSTPLSFSGYTGGLGTIDGTAPVVFFLHDDDGNLSQPDRSIRAC